MISQTKAIGKIQPLVYFIVVMSLGTLISSCSDTEPTDSPVQYFVINKSSEKIDRLTISLETQESGNPYLTDSVHITNLPINLSVRLTYDIKKNTEKSGVYRLTALGNRKKWSNTFGSFSAKTDHDPDRTYHLEIMEDSVVVIP